MKSKDENERRRFLTVLASGAMLVVAGCGSRGSSERRSKSRDKEGEEEISPAEDLMREHGVLERVLLIYEESASRLAGKSEAPLEVLGKSAGIIRRFVEDYHERLVEQFLFPRLEAAKLEIELVITLRSQHVRGRALTDQIKHLTAPGNKLATADHAQLVRALRSFARMYRPHAAREDTVLFPAFQRLVGRAAYHELGEQFEEREHWLFGKHGFADVVREVAGLERRLGIHDLARFTAP